MMAIGRYLFFGGRPLTHGKRKDSERAAAVFHPYFFIFFLVGAVMLYSHWSAVLFGGGEGGGVRGLGGGGAGDSARRFFPKDVLQGRRREHHHKVSASKYIFLPSHLSGGGAYRGRQGGRVGRVWGDIYVLSISLSPLRARCKTISKSHIFTYT